MVSESWNCINKYNMNNLIIKVKESGISSLTDKELLSMFVGKNKLESVFDTYGNSFANLARADFDELKNLGLTARESLFLLSISEIARRKKYVDLVSVNSSLDIFNYMSPLMSDLYYEVVWAIYLNNKGEIIYKRKIGQGGIDSSDCDIKILFYHALMCHARGLVLVHNHPSGKTIPSLQDDKLTERVKKIATLHSITFLDHLIIAKDDYYSYGDNGKI